MKLPFTSMSSDSFDEFVTFATTSRSQYSPSKSEKSDSGFSISQQKVGKRNGLQSINRTNKNVRKGRLKCKNNKRESASTGEKFCPLCQMPLNCLNILPEIHVSGCSVVWNELRECLQGRNCIETNIFHFKDFSHKILAEFRATEAVSYVPDSPKTDPSDAEQKLSVKKRIISETESESSLDLLSDEVNSVKQCVQASHISDRAKRNQKKEVPTPTPPIPPAPSSSSSQSTFFEPEKSNYIDKYVSDTVNSVAICSRSEVTNVLQNIVSQHSSENRHAEIKTKSHLHCSKLTNKRKDTIPCSDESSKSVSILKPSIEEATVKKPFRVKMPSKILKKSNTYISRQCSEKVQNGHAVEDVSVKLHKGIFACDNPGSPETAAPQFTCEEVSVSVDENELTEMSLKNKLNFKGSIKFKRKHDRELDSSIVKSPVNSKTIPCKCLQGNSSETPSVEMEISSPKKAFVSPVKMHLTYDKSGWQELGIDTIPEAILDKVNVGMCECGSAMHVECTVANPITALTKESPSKKVCLESRFASSLDDLGFAGKLTHRQATKEVAVLSHIGQGGAYSTNVTFSQKATSAESKEKCKSTKEEWKQIMDRMKRRGYADMQIVSSESVSSSSENMVTKDTSMYNSKVKKCPFYKKIPDTSFVVDAFQYGIIPGITAYFLSHFHSDHYIGLRKGFNKQIYCSEVTAALVKKKIGVDEKYLTSLEVNEQRVIGMVQVTAMDANHCPGSLMLLFQLPDGRSFLHVGDFRFHNVMKLYPAIQQCQINKLFLDTTYCDPKYDFPPQEEVIRKAIEITKTTLQKCPKTLIVCGTYLIGKEKVFMGISEAIGAKVWARPDKRGILKCLCDPNIEKSLVLKPYQAQVHVLTMKELNCQDLKNHLNTLEGIYSNVLAFRPSGWELQATGSSLNFRHSGAENIIIYGVPYSEHSSYSELCEFVQFLRPEQIVPTVNVGQHSILQRHFSSWLSQPGPSKTQKKLSSYLNFH